MKADRKREEGRKEQGEAQQPGRKRLVQAHTAVRILTRKYRRTVLYYTYLQYVGALHAVDGMPRRITVRFDLPARKNGRLSSTVQPPDPTARVVPNIIQYCTWSETRYLPLPL